MKQDTLDDSDDAVLGYRFESQARGGPDGERALTDWSEKHTSWHPGTFANAIVRNVVELVPTRDEEEAVAYYFETEINGEVDANVVTFDPNRLDRTIMARTPLKEGDTIEVDTGEHKNPDLPLV